MSKIKDWYDGLEPETKINLVKYIGYPLLFLLLITPSIIWFSIPNHYNSKQDWLQDFAWIFPLTLVGAGFITTVSYLIYNYVKDTKK